MESGVDGLCHGLLEKSPRNLLPRAEAVCPVAAPNIRGEKSHGFPTTAKRDSRRVHRWQCRPITRQALLMFQSLVVGAGLSRDKTQRQILRALSRRKVYPPLAAPKATRAAPAL
jgi:hypothetical protein